MSNGSFIVWVLTVSTGTVKKCGKVGVIRALYNLCNTTGRLGWSWGDLLSTSNEEETARNKQIFSCNALSFAWIGAQKGVTFSVIMNFFFHFNHKLRVCDFERERNRSTVIELISEHPTHHEDTTLICRYRPKSGKQGPAVGMHTFLIPQRFHSQSRIFSFRQKTESDKNTKTHSPTVVQTSDTSRVLLEMLPVSSKDMWLCEEQMYSVLIVTRLKIALCMGVVWKTTELQVCDTVRVTVTDHGNAKWL